MWWGIKLLLTSRNACLKSQWWNNVSRILQEILWRYLSSHLKDYSGDGLNLGHDVIVNLWCHKVKKRSNLQLTYILQVVMGMEFHVPHTAPKYAAYWAILKHWKHGQLLPKCFPYCTENMCVCIQLCKIKEQINLGTSLLLIYV